MSTEAELLDLSQKLLDSIDQKDWETYAELCDPALTAYEPEAVGNLVTGMAFHKFYFEMRQTGGARQSTICEPLVRCLGDVALITYVRLVQSIDEEGHANTSVCEETRVWQQQSGRWKHIHFHRSKSGAIRL